MMEKQQEARRGGKKEKGKASVDCRISLERYTYLLLAPEKFNSSRLEFLEATRTFRAK